MLWLGLSFWWANPAWAVVRIGMTPEQVMAELGKPNGERSSGHETLWVYGSGGRLTFEHGVLVRVTGIEYSGESEASSERWLTPETAPELQTGVRFSDGRAAPQNTRTGAFFEREGAESTPEATAQPPFEAAAPVPSAVPGFEIPPALLQPVPGVENNQTRLIRAMGQYRPSPAGEEAALQAPADDPLALMPTEAELAARDEDAFSEAEAYDEMMNDLAELGGYDPDAVKALTGGPQVIMPGMGEEEAELEAYGWLVYAVKFAYCAFISFALIWILIKVFNEEMFLTSMLLFAALDATILVGVEAAMKAWGFPGAMTVDYLLAVIVMALLLPFLSCVKDHIQSLKIMFIHKVLQYGLTLAFQLIAFFWVLSLFAGSCAT
ncbi:MAG: hypothetical protein Q7P63_13065 [Verrucomicrobiota bacterium JB022]|nr:hypothetical protein [Verrucomicrobiota bacterium JB022]